MYVEADCKPTAPEKHNRFEKNKVRKDGWRYLGKRIMKAP